jgi:hypothetical protein
VYGNVGSFPNHVDISCGPHADTRIPPVPVRLMTCATFFCSNESICPAVKEFVILGSTPIQHTGEKLLSAYVCVCVCVRERGGKFSFPDDGMIGLDCFIPQSIMPRHLHGLEACTQSLKTSLFGIGPPDFMFMCKICHFPVEVVLVWCRKSLNKNIHAYLAIRLL